MAEQRSRPISVPMIASAKLSPAHSFMPEALPPQLQMLVVTGNSMLPLYRHGDTLVISEGTPMKAGDRVIVRDHEQRVTGGTLFHIDSRHAVILQGGQSRREMQIALAEVDCLARVVWASQ